MIATYIDNIEDEKSHLYNCPPLSANHITTLLHYRLIKLKSFILNIIAISIISIIAAAFVLFTFSRNLQIDASGKATLMLSIKNTMSVAATVHAVGCMTRMVMDVVPEKTKADYVDPSLDYLVTFGVDSLIEISNTVISYFDQNNEL